MNEYERGVADGLSAGADVVDRLRRAMAQVTSLSTPYDMAMGDAFEAAVEALRNSKVVEDYR